MTTKVIEGKRLLYLQLMYIVIKYLHDFLFKSIILVYLHFLFLKKHINIFYFLCLFRIIMNKIYYNIAFLWLFCILVSQSFLYTFLTLTNFIHRYTPDTFVYNFKNNMIACFLSVFFSSLQNNVCFIPILRCLLIVCISYIINCFRLRIQFLFLIFIGKLSKKQHIFFYHMLYILAVSAIFKIFVYCFSYFQNILKIWTSYFFARVIVHYNVQVKLINFSIYFFTMKYLKKKIFLYFQQEGNQLTTIN